MSSNRHGLGNTSSPVGMVTPSPAVIQEYFKSQIHYFLDTPAGKKPGEPVLFNEERICRYAHYKNILNKCDAPLFECLKDITCISHIIVDLWYGYVQDAWFELRYHGKGSCPGIEKFKGVKINSFAQLAAFDDPELGCPPLVWVFKWHLNIVHMTREYLKGGWLERPKRVKELAKAKESRKFLNKFGPINIIKNAKPELGEGSWYQEKAEPKKNKNHGCGTTFDDLIEMADKIDMSRSEEASKYLDSLLEKEDK